MTEFKFIYALPIGLAIVSLIGCACRKYYSKKEDSRTTQQMNPLCQYV